MTISLRHTSYGQTDHAGQNSLANASGKALDTMREAIADAEIGDRISYDDLESIDDMERDTLRRLLAELDMSLVDDGDGYLVVPRD